MREFFAFLRKEMFRVASNVVIGALARDTIEKEYLPKIEKAISKEKNERKKAQLQELYDGYAEYASTSKKGREFDKAAAAAIRQTVKAFGGGEQELDDVAQETAANLLGAGAGRAKAWAKASGKFDPLKNHPKKLVSFFTSVVSTRARSVWRDMSEAAKAESRKIKEVSLVDEEGQMVDVPSQRVELNEFDDAWMRDTMVDMSRHILSKLSKPWMKEMFKNWLKVAVSSGAESVKFTKDIIEPMIEEGGDNPGTPSMYRRTWKGIVEMMVDYFEQVLPKQGEPPVLLTNKAKSKLLRAAADRVAAFEYRAAFCRWMLGR